MMQFAASAAAIFTRNYSSSGRRDPPLSPHSPGTALYRRVHGPPTATPPEGLIGNGGGPSENVTQQLDGEDAHQKSGAHPAQRSQPRPLKRTGMGKITCLFQEALLVVGQRQPETPAPSPSSTASKLPGGLRAERTS